MPMLGMRGTGEMPNELFMPFGAVHRITGCADYRYGGPGGWDCVYCGTDQDIEKRRCQCCGAPREGRRHE